MYINVGVKINGNWAPSKKAIKEAMTNAPETVQFVGTSPFQPLFAQGDQLILDDGTKLSFVGPDPFNKRNFYGTVENTTKGIKVS